MAVKRYTPSVVKPGIVEDPHGSLVSYEDYKSHLNLMTKDRDDLQEKLKSATTENEDMMHENLHLIELVRRNQALHAEVQKEISILKDRFENDTSVLDHAEAVNEANKDLAQEILDLEEQAEANYDLYLAALELANMLSALLSKQFQERE